MAELASLTFPITKRVTQSDGTLIIEGPVTDDSLDLDGQIVDAASAAKSLQEWFDAYANVRQQHSPLLAPAGKGLALKFKNGVPWLRAHIVEPTAVKLTAAGVYSAFSVGIADGQLDQSPVACKRAPNGILYPSLINEVSVVDYPANIRMGKFSIAKRRKDGVIKEVNRLTVAKSLRGLDADSLVAALKSAHEGAIVHTCATAKEARKLIGTQFDESDYEARGNVIVAKRQMDPDVGGGVDRDKIPAKDFAGPNRTYPIATPGDVQDAASLIGKADDPDAVKAKIIRIAQRKGPSFVAELPKKWRKEMGQSQKASKAPGSKDKPFPGAAAPFGKDETDEERAERKAKKKDKKAAKAAKAMEGDKHMVGDDCPPDDAATATKAGIPPIDQEVTEDLKDADAALGEAQEAQAKDNDRHERGDDADDSDADAKKGSKKKLAKKAAKARAADAVAMKRAHDALCPFCKNSVTKSLDSVASVIDPDLFRHRLESVSPDAVETYLARKAAFDAAVQVSNLKVKTFVDMRRAARKSFLTAYPDLKVASPDLSDPSSFQRGFLPSATKETSTSTSKPGNFVDSHPLAPEQFMRGPLTQNEARPSLVGGVPATAMAHKGRQFYTNADKDTNSAAMATLHEHIVSNYPAVCPGMNSEVNDRLGTPPEMYSPNSAMTHDTDTRGSALAGVTADVAARATKRAVDDAVSQITEVFTKREKKLNKRIEKLNRQVKRELARPDWSKSARRVAEFAPTHAAAPASEDNRERVQRAKMLSGRIHDRHSITSPEDLRELQDLVSPEEFGAMLASGN